MGRSRQMTEEVEGEETSEEEQTSERGGGADG